MNLFLLWMRRKPFIALLLILLLSVGAAFGSVGVSSFFAANRQTETAARVYTTVAIPYDPVWLGRTPVERYDGGPDSPFRYYDLDAILKDVPVSVQPCPVVPLQGIIPDSVNVKPADFDSSDRFWTYSVTKYADYACVAAVRCDSVTDCSRTRIYTSWDAESKTGTWTYGVESISFVGEVMTETEKSFSYTFSVVETICMPELSKNQYHAATLELDTRFCKTDGSPIFEEGKTYLIFGRLDPAELAFVDPEEETHTGFFPFADAYRTEKEIHGDGTVYLTYDGQYPMAAEYTGSTEDFLNSEEGRVWREVLIPAAERNHHCVLLLAADCAECLAPFCTRQADLIEGRTFTAEEAENGARVCLVSSAWAEKNGVLVGDVLPIAVYAPRIDVEQFVGAYEGSGYTGPEQDLAYLQMQPSYAVDAVGQTGDYEIIGVFVCPPSDQGSLCIGPDTVVIPKSSVGNAERYRTADMAHYPLLNPYLLPNGAQEKLEAWLSERGLGGRFLYYDYGFSAAGDAIGQMTRNGTRMLCAGVCAFALSLLLFVLLLRLLLAHSVRSMRLLGESPASIRKRFARTIPLWSILPVLLGMLLNRIGFGWATEKLMASTLPFQDGIAGIAAFAEWIVICVVLWIAGARAARVRLMQGGKR
ncbi:MAG: hypothetical protein IJJ86_04170 [Clostridia bacterium]|nr:hypothetical protein [Clostridia bacterium]